MEFTGERYVPGTIADTEANTGYEHWQRYLSAKNLVEDKRVLDVACGEGYGSYTLSEVAKSVMGVDISSEAVEHAQKTYQRDNLRFKESTMTQLPVADGSIDAVVSFETIEHVDLESQCQFLQEVCRVLDDDGILCVSCPNEPIASTRAFELWGYKNPFHVKEHSISEFKALLESFFPSVQLLFQRTENAIILSAPSCSSLHVQFGDQWNQETAQNTIAVCGKQPIDLSSLNSIVFDLHEGYLKREKCISDYMRENQRLMQTLQVSEERKQALEEQLNEVKQQNAILLNSTSWRFTKPFRMLFSKLRNMIKTNGKWRK